MTTKNSQALTQLPKWKILNITTLKIIAVVLMFMDHIHQMFLCAGAPTWLTMVGRLVFPIFLFAAAESFHYTHSKRKYLQRLLFASWGMTLFTLLLQQAVPNENVVLMNNAFSTFFLTGLYMLFWDWFIQGIRKKEIKLIIKAVLFSFIPVLCALLPVLLVTSESISYSVMRYLTVAIMFIPNILTVEGGFAFVLLGLLFYIFREKRSIQIAVLLIMSVLTYLISGGFQWLMCLASIPMVLYNGERGRGMKGFFYVFYPAHIGILYLISTFFV